jgi:hypothetical protein
VFKVTPPPPPLKFKFVTGEEGLEFDRVRFRIGPPPRPKEDGRKMDEFPVGEGGILEGGIEGSDVSDFDR